MYPVMTPYLTCTDLKASLEWFGKIGFKIMNQMNCPQTGVPMHAEIQRDGMHFMLGSVRPGMEWEKPGSSASFYLTMGGKDFDLDGLCKEFKGKGITVTFEPQDQFYGHRMFAISHPDGFTFTFGKVIAELSAEEMKENMQKMMAGAGAK